MGLHNGEPVRSRLKFQDRRQQPRESRVGDSRSTRLLRFDPRSGRSPNGCDIRSRSVVAGRPVQAYSSDAERGEPRSGALQGNWPATELRRANNVLMQSHFPSTGDKLHLFLPPAATRSATPILPHDQFHRRLPHEQSAAATCALARRRRAVVVWWPHLFPFHAVTIILPICSPASR